MWLCPRATLAEELHDLAVVYNPYVALLAKKAKKLVDTKYCTTTPI